MRTAMVAVIALVVSGIGPIGLVDRAAAWSWLCDTETTLSPSHPKLGLWLVVNESGVGITVCYSTSNSADPNPLAGGSISTGAGTWGDLDGFTVFTGLICLSDPSSLGPTCNTGASLSTGMPTVAAHDEPGDADVLYTVGWDLWFCGTLGCTGSDDTLVKNGVLLATVREDPPPPGATTGQSFTVTGTELWVDGSRVFGDSSVTVPLFAYGAAHGGTPGAVVTVNPLDPLGAPPCNLAGCLGPKGIVHLPAYGNTVYVAVAGTVVPLPVTHPGACAYDNDGAGSDNCT